MNILELRNELATLLASEIGTYTLPNGATTPAISVRSSGKVLPSSTTATGLEVVIIRDPDLTPIRQYEEAGALRSWTVLLVDWSDAVNLEPIGAYLIEAYPGTQVATVPVPKGTGPQNQLRVTIQSSASSPTGFPPYSPISFPTVSAISFDLDDAISVGPGQLAWDPEEATLELGRTGGVQSHLGFETLVLCRNNSNTIAIPRGTGVMFAGTLGSSGRIKVAPMVANGSVPGYVFFGITAQAIAGASDGYVMTFGKLRNINTNTYADGDILWCNPTTPGGFTKIEPQAPNLKLPVAAVVKAATNGTVFVRTTTGTRLSDCHDVESGGSKADGDILEWDAPTSRWLPSNRLTLLEARVTALET